MVLLSDTHGFLRWDNQDPALHGRATITQVTADRTIRAFDEVAQFWAG